MEKDPGGIRKVSLLARAALMLLLCVFAVGAQSAYGSNRSDKVTLSINSQPVKTVLNEIEQQTGYVFIANTNVDTNRRVSITLTDAPVQTALDRIFAGTGVYYTFSDRHIVLSKTPASNEASEAGASDQTAKRRTISGVVKDAEGEPLIGVTVRIKGKSIATTTNVEGCYVLSGNISSNDKIEFSYVGMQTKTEALNNQNTVNVVLSDDKELLDEVVVVGYGTQKRINLTGAVSTVDGSRQLASRPITDVARGLQGAVSGMTVTTSTGEMGVDPTIKIRGMIGSTNGNSQPLILVDNVECNSLQNINPEDIESISVLKDAAASSIYGVKAAFGVVLITTKKAHKGERFTVSYSNNFSWKSPTVTPALSKTYENAEATLLIAQRSRGANYTDITNTCNMAWNLESIERMREWDRVYGNINLSPEMVLGRDFDIINGKMYFYRGWDVTDMFVKHNSFQQNHNVAISGSSGNTTYNVSLGYLGSTGIMKVNPDSYNRYNVSFGTQSTLNKWFDIRTKLLYTRYENKSPHNMSNASSTYDEWYYLYRWPAFMPYGTYQGISWHNAVTEIAQANMDVKTNNYMRITLGTTAHVIENLDVDVDYTFTHVSRFTELNGGKAEGWDFWGGNGLVNKVWTADALNFTQKDTDMSDFHVLNAIARYKLNIADSQEFNFMAGCNVEAYSSYGNTAKRNDLLLNDRPQISLATGDQFATAYRTHESRLGYFARVNYSLFNRYLLELNGRFDGSSNFPSNQRWGFFPSASAGWLVSEEKFMSAIRPTVSLFKIRGSWGQIGNQDVGSNRFLPILSSTQTTWVINGSRELSFGMPTAIADGFTWETITTLNGGLDLRFFNNQLGLSADIFQRRNSNMITSGETLPSTFGQTAPLQNYGELTTNGWEISVDFNHRFPFGLTMSATAYISDATTKYTKINSNSRLIGDIYEGKTYGEIWGYETDRLFQVSDFQHDADGNLLLNAKGYPILNEGIPSQAYYETNGWFYYGPGDVKYKDLDGDGKITPGDGTIDNPGDKKVIGNSTPRYEYGVRLNLEYEGVDFSIFFQGVGKRDVWGNGPIVVPGFWGHHEAWYAHQMDYWREDNTQAFYPRPTDQGQSSNAMNFLPQTRYLLNMAYCRLKNLTVGYTLPRKWTRKALIDKFRVYASFENLFEFDHMGDIPIDPETRNATGDGGYLGRSYPYTRNCSFGVQLTF